MEALARRLILIGAITMSGAVGGYTLGNFAAREQRPSGAEELAEYRRALLDVEERPEAFAYPEPGSATAPRRGPTAYECQGCDAQLYPDFELGDVADYEPLPPYSVHGPEGDMGSVAVPAAIPAAAAAMPRGTSMAPRAPNAAPPAASAMPRALSPRISPMTPRTASPRIAPAATPDLPITSAPLVPE